MPKPDRERKFINCHSTRRRKASCSPYVSPPWALVFPQADFLKLSIYKPVSGLWSGDKDSNWLAYLHPDWRQVIYMATLIFFSFSFLFCFLENNGLESEIIQREIFDLMVTQEERKKPTSLCFWHPQCFNLFINWKDVIMSLTGLFKNAERNY